LTVLGFSSSPIVDGNVDRMVKFVLQNLKISQDLFKQWEDFPELIRKIEKLSQDLKAHLPPKQLTIEY